MLAEQVRGLRARRWQRLRSGRLREPQALPRRAAPRALRRAARAPDAPGPPQSLSRQGPRSESAECESRAATACPVPPRRGRPTAFRWIRMGTAALVVNPWPRATCAHWLDAAARLSMRAGRPVRQHPLGRTITARRGPHAHGNALRSPVEGGDLGRAVGFEPEQRAEVHVAEPRRLLSNRRKHAFGGDILCGKLCD